MDLIEARDHLDLAKKQWDSAATDSWEPEEPESCVSNVFYAYENVIVALCEALNVEWTKNHYKKAEIAEELAKQGKVSKDVSKIMLHLNELRKDVSYGEPGAALLNEDLEALVSELEHFIGEAENIVSTLEDEATEDDDE